MKALIFLSVLCMVRCQFFNSTYLEEVTQEPLRSYGALPQCGENERQGLDVCVPYYNCDPETRKIIQTGVRDGFNMIGIRYNLDDQQCDHYLDVCCQIPQSNDTQSTSTTTTTTTASTVTRLVTPSSSERTPYTSNVPRTTESISPRPQTNEISNNENSNEDWSNCGKRNPNAAHCVNRFKAPDITVRAGEWDTQTTKERIPTQKRIATKVILHENYGINGENDIALVILDRPYTKVESIATICLPATNQFINSKHCFASGWGRTEFGREGAYSVILKKIELPIVPNSECEPLLKRTRLGPKFKLHHSFTCAGGLKGKDTCTGDGGSPLVCPDPSNPQRYIQTGIVSWGIGCGTEGVPGVYVDVSQYATWIERALRNENI
ncbi:hypothetical protein HHI36_016227 [Cryptolaemus montrouzieri]|uniref:Peptidase S1 domain-containing protein n=1 Tax=Cryptolaemus montrouzieri TaxID=559131 RepID=A0ABD2NJ30_9CUCU